MLLDCGSVPLVGKWIEWLVTYVILGFAALVGGVIGLCAEYGEYTPKRPAKRYWVGEGKGKET